MTLEINLMNFENYILEAIEMVSAWPDIPEEVFGRTVNEQASLMSGNSIDDFFEQPSETL